MNTAADKKRQRPGAPVVKRIEVPDRKARREFVLLENRWLSSYPFFVPATTRDTTKILAGQSPFYSEMEYALLVASAGNYEKARCAALINRQYQKAKGEAVGFIGYFAAMPGAEPEVKALVDAGSHPGLLRRLPG